MSGPALVSIVVPTYNYAKFLPQALDSVLDQIYQAWECIVVDDASLDETPAIIQRYARDPRFRTVAHRMNLGVSASRNDGLEASRGAFIQFLDADDRLLTHKIVRHVRYLEAHPECGVVYSEAGYFRDRDPERLMPSMHGRLSRSIMARVHGNEEARQKLAHYNFIPMPSALVRREAIDAAGRFVETSAGCEDWDFWLRCAAAGARFDFEGDDAPLVAIRAHPQSASAQPLRMVHGLIDAAKAYPAPDGLPLIYDVALGYEQVLRGERRAGSRRIAAAAARATEPLTALRWRAYALAARVLPKERFLSFVARPMPEWPLEIYRRWK